jgi:pimeloyl-ACP methyl ester carboxylesterase
MSNFQVRVRGPWAVLLGASLLISLMTAPATANQSDPLEVFYNQSLKWTKCGKASCTFVTVPLDYQQPDDFTITLAIRRIGSPDLPPLIMNPGGPGSEGTAFTQSIAASLDSSVTDAFTPVGFDPRGTGKSAPVKCFTGPSANKWLRIDSTPDTKTEIANYMSAAAKISPACQRMSPDIVAHIGTENTVRDMDIVRATLGSQKLNWLGFSYGTSLGTRYAELFPDKVGRMVLDGAVDPSLNSMELSRGQSRGFQKAIGRFNGQYPGSITMINRLLRALDRTEMDTEGSQTLTQSEATTAIFLSMYSPSFWPSLHEALQEASQGNGTLLQELSYYANDQITPTKFSSNVLSAFISINCWDYPPTPGATELARSARQFSRKAKVPELARAMSWGNAPCSTWFEHSSIKPAPAETTTSAPILIIGTTYDPATPLAWARALHEQLPTSSLLTFVSDGHTAYLGGSTCVDQAVDNYLLTGVAPKTKTC